jgi:hypothetical protein
MSSGAGAVKSVAAPTTAKFRNIKVKETQSMERPKRWRSRIAMTPVRTKKMEKPLKAM